MKIYKCLKIKSLIKKKKEKKIFVSCLSRVLKLTSKGMTFGLAVLKTLTLQIVT